MEKKELMVCTCGNSILKVYVSFKGYKMEKILVKCPKCGKESLVAFLDGETKEEVFSKS